MQPENLLSKQWRYSGLSIIQPLGKAAGTLSMHNMALQPNPISFPDDRVLTPVLSVRTPVRLFRFPADKTHRQLWVNKLKRIEENEKDWKPKQQEGVCNKHFVPGNRSTDKTRPDYLPTQNLGCVTHCSTVVIRAIRGRENNSKNR